IRLVTRLSHSRSGVETKEIVKENGMSFPEDPNQFMLLPAFSRKKYNRLVPLQEELEKASEESPFNKYIDGSDKTLGIIACGLGYNYLMENVSKTDFNHPILKISQYPLPRKHVERMMKECAQVLVIEDGQPLVEQQLKGYVSGNTKVRGRLDGSLPRVGELNPNHVAKALNLPDTHGEAIPEVVTGRPPALCVGCPHSDSFYAIKEALKDYPNAKTFGDIGCYTLGFMPPYRAIDTTLDMGASITMAKGASEAGVYPAIATIGDSTFFHSGMTGLMDCVYDKSNVVIVILDNSTTGMTGGQEYTGFGRIESVCIGLGVDPEHIRVITPLKNQHEKNVQVFKEEIAYTGVSVIIPRRECIQTLKKKNRK
ncbi:MAG: thiamine pyrophosphate-dependent enzyme, partial [Candidatus Cloacimonadales bacterium]